MAQESVLRRIDLLIPVLSGYDGVCLIVES